MAMGSLFYVAPDSSIASSGAENIFGKYRILKKTANFFSNQFTWMLVFFSIFVFAVFIKFLRNWLKKRQDY
jgi:asparagine N-glycosylation enzyme membrane subunit Stt3